MLSSLLFALILQADAVTVQTKTRVYAHEGFPSVIVTVKGSILGATLRLKREDLQVFDFEVPMKKGVYTYKLQQAPGTALDYEGELEVRFPKDEVGSIPLNFTGEVVVPIEVQTTASLAQLSKRQFEATTNREIVRVDMTITGEGGVPLGKHTFKVEKPSRHFVVEWPKLSAPVLVIEAAFTDAANVARTMLLYPWYVDVPHEEVVFASAEFAVAKSEEPKLQAAYDKIIDAAQKAMKHAPVKLYVVGHTDTVGAADKNQTLSQKRAQAIAQYFRKHGFTLPVAFAGMGETSLAVATPDETDNAQNRRAQYLLAIDPPTLGRPVTWFKL